MTFLPIVERELRVASRRHFTYWSRIATAAFALLIFAALYTLYLISKGAMSVGTIQFGILKWMCFAFASCVGIFLTSDSISEEKREGTLGLLFLTDLKGYDVVLGKLLSQSLRAFYGVLAAFPIMGLTLLTGGVSGGEFGRSLMVITNTLFLSLAAGLFISTISRDSTKAMNGTMLLMLLLTGGMLLTDLLLTDWKTGGFRPFFCTASPAWLLYSSGSYPIKNYWSYLGLQHGIAWLFLIVSSLLAARTWHEKASKQTARSSWFQRWRFGGARLRLKLRRKYLEINPVLWLGLRDRWLPRIVFTVALVMLVARVGTLMAAYVYEDDQSYNWPRVVGMILSAFTKLFGLLLILWVAGAASRLLLDATRNGAMELMLVTPLDPRRIVQGQWAALCRIFLLPVLCIFLLHIISGIETALMYSNLNRGGSSFLPDSIPACVNVALSVISTITGLAATAWFGMWMGLTTKKNAIAVLLNICFVTILPLIVSYFVMAMAMASLSFAGIGAALGTAFVIYLPTVVINSLCLVKDILFILWARKRLLNRFREAVLRDKGMVFRRVTPMVPPMPGAGPLSSPPPLATA